MTEPRPDLAAMLNDNPGGWNRAMGLRFVRATADEVEAEWDIGPEHLQPYGIIHGGVLSGVIETLCSVGAALHAGLSNRGVVGLENHTSFIHAARSGRMRARATPLTRGRRSQLWESTVRDGNDRIVASGRVRLLCLEPDADLAGQKLDLRKV